MKNIVLLVLIILINLSCSKKKNYNKEEAIILDWLSAVKELNYDLYRSKVAFPRDINVFKAMYQDYYIEFPIIEKVEEKSEKVTTDAAGNQYYKRKLYFNAKIIMRNKVGKNMLLRADVILIKFLNGDRQNDGWLISNRTFIRVPLN